MVIHFSHSKWTLKIFLFCHIALKTKSQAYFNKKTNSSTFIIKNLQCYYKQGWLSVDSLFLTSLCDRCLFLKSIPLKSETLVRKSTAQLFPHCFTFLKYIFVHSFPMCFLTHLKTSYLNWWQWSTDLFIFWLQKYGDRGT